MLSTEGRVEERDQQPVDAPDELPTSPAAAPRTPLQKERWRAARLAREAQEVMAHQLDRVRQGGRMDAAPVTAIATRIVDSVTRNADALRSLGLVRQRDRYTFEHSVNVAVLASAFGQSQGLSCGALHDLALAGLLHDVGKGRTPLAILNKPGRLDADEWKVMKHHVVETRSILEEAGFSSAVVSGAAEHHERHDGSGYPNGLAGEAITPFGRMIGIADYFDAVTSDRIYREGETPATVLRRLMETAGREFDAPFVHRFIKSVGIFPVGTLVRLQSDRLAVVIAREHRDLLRPLIRVFFDTRAKRYTPPQDIDLAIEPCVDAIASAENPARWGVKPHLYMS